ANRRASPSAGSSPCTPPGRPARRARSAPQQAKISLCVPSWPSPFCVEWIASFRAPSCGPRRVIVPAHPGPCQEAGGARDLPPIGVSLRVRPIHKICLIFSQSESLTITAGRAAARARKQPAKRTHVLVPDAVRNLVNAGIRRFQQALTSIDQIAYRVGYEDVSS